MRFYADSWLIVGFFDDIMTISVQFYLSSTALLGAAKFRSIHSLILFCYVCLPRRLF